jgi:hypothetical protein
VIRRSSVIRLQRDRSFLGLAVEQVDPAADEADDNQGANDDNQGSHDSKVSRSVAVSE